MDNKSKRALIVVIGLLLMVAIIMICSSLKSDDVQVKVSWSYYPDYGSKDVKKLFITFHKYAEDGSAVDLWQDEVAPTDSSFKRSVAVGFEYVVWMGAVDSNGYVSRPSNRDTLELFPPKEVKNVEVEVL